LTILEDAANKLGLNLVALERHFLNAKQISSSICERIVKALNYELPEIELNRELEKLSVEILKYDLRGTLIDIFFSIKEKRDEIIEKLASSDYREEIEEDLGNEEKNNPFWYLEADLEFVKPSNVVLEEYSCYDSDFYMHQTLINYYNLSKISQEIIEKNLMMAKERIDKEQTYFINNICKFYFLSIIF
jgi:hypothetical protein